MATMTIVLSDIEEVSPAYRPNENSIRIRCNMANRDMEDIMCQICEEFGEDAFLKLANKILT